MQDRLTRDGHLRVCGIGVGEHGLVVEHAALLGPEDNHVLEAWHGRELGVEAIGELVRGDEHAGARCLEHLAMRLAAVHRVQCGAGVPTEGEPGHQLQAGDVVRSKGGYSVARLDAAVAQ